MPSSINKQQWRQQLRVIRQQCANRDGAKGRKLVADMIARSLSSMQEWQQAQCIASYRSIGDELDPSVLSALARQDHKRVVYPRITGPGLMSFCDWREGEPLETSLAGITQPTAAATIAAIDEIDFFIIPLLGCDLTGLRLGYGGGFYDRALMGTQGFRCGIGYQAQLVVKLPREDHDVALRGMVTEAGINRF
tara:strand:+ start:265 stop:843 length:579 start_codon:yes stop_codon:yes gene_type:complete